MNTRFLVPWIAAVVILFAASCEPKSVLRGAVPNTDVLDPLVPLNFAGTIPASGSVGGRVSAFPVSTDAENSCARGLVLTFGIADPDRAFAAASFDDTVNATGWGVLTVSTRPIDDDSEGSRSSDNSKSHRPSSTSDYSEDWCRFYAAGVVEGALTVRRMLENYRVNLFNAFGNLSAIDPSQRPQPLVLFLETHDLWMETFVPPGPFTKRQHRSAAAAGDVRVNRGADHQAPKGRRGMRRSLKSEKVPPVGRFGEDALWGRVGLLFAQRYGLRDGYNLIATALGLPLLDDFAMHMLSGMNDVSDIMKKLYPDRRPHLSSSSSFDESIFSDHCSALISLTDDFSEVFIAHSTWSSYNTMNRIFKHYTLWSHLTWVEASINNSDDPNVLREETSFSSYPGMLFSSDDYYLNFHSNLTVMETTMSVFNGSLYDAIVPECLFVWMRMRLANAVATTGEEWGIVFSTFASGTYPNEYIVFDWKLFTPGLPLPDGTLWIVEEVPTLVAAADVTDTLARGYWPSYNRAFLAPIADLAGYPDAVRRLGPAQSYELYPRAKIFRRDHAQAQTESGTGALLRSNAYRTDPFSAGDPANAVCARADLRTTGARAFGCLDTKFTSGRLYAERSMRVVSGPTLGTDGTLPPFLWSAFPDAYHSGVPSSYTQFTFETMTFGDLY